MELFIGNISERTHVADLIAFFKGFEKKTTFRIEEKRLEDGTLCRYGVANFNEEKLALKALKKLDGKPLLGRNLHLREFFYRSYSNERRALNWRDRPWDGPERRVSERRKKEQATKRDEFDEILASSQRATVMEEGDPEKITITGYHNLARKG